MKTSGPRPRRRGQSGRALDLLLNLVNSQVMILGGMLAIGLVLFATSKMASIMDWLIGLIN